ncbi:MAG: hypothetical protein BGP04_25140 [Rhizobiales bacterium 62-17]|jgi:hypothetical protein|nr:hypothetical protein [Hyphomicrobiales bacterium]OJY00787.1 MAG: hypothetical protein BGP04_25140 [Rhizobiales bacterium 62-17]
MRIDDLNFEYEPDVYAYVSDYSGIDLVVQPLRIGFAAEVVDGAKVHVLGAFPSERWAKKAALDAAMEISALTR